MIGTMIKAVFGLAIGLGLLWLTLGLGYILLAFSVALLVSH